MGKTHRKISDSDTIKSLRNRIKEQDREIDQLKAQLRKYREEPKKEPKTKAPKLTDKQKADNEREATRKKWADIRASWNKKDSE